MSRRKRKPGEDRRDPAAPSERVPVGHCVSCSKYIYSRGLPKCPGCGSEIQYVPTTLDQLNRLLAKLKLNCLKDYVNSPNYQVIRDDILKRHDECCGCHQPPVQLFFSEFTWANMTGENDKHITPLCNDCFRYVQLKPNNERRDEAYSRAYLARLTKLKKGEKVGDKKVKFNDLGEKWRLKHVKRAKT